MPVCGECALLHVKAFEVGLLSTNCYVASCSETKEAVIVDAGFDQGEAEEIFSFMEANCLKLKLVVCTHGHPDHVCGNRFVKEKFDVPIAIHEADAYMLGESGRTLSRFFGFDCVSPTADLLLQDGDALSFGKITFRAMHCPGHSPGSIVLLGEKEIFTGDVLFSGSIGRTDFPGSSDTEMTASLRRLLSVPDSFKVFSGHGPSTVMGLEKRVNPFLLGL